MWTGKAGDRRGDRFLSGGQAAAGASAEELEAGVRGQLAQAEGAVGGSGVRLTLPHPPDPSLPHAVQSCLLIHPGLS